jgi:CheY-like chemotaxis protein
MMAREPFSILMFEDDYESMHDLKEYLEEDLGWRVELSAEQGLPERLCTDRFDLIILDLMIKPQTVNAAGVEVNNVHYPDVVWRKTGPEFLRRLRAGEYRGSEGQGTLPDVPVLLLSAVAGYSVEEELGKDVRYSAYLEKPFRLEELTEQIRKLLKE